MDFIDKIRELSCRISKQLESILTEEATKHAIIMPFIAALGYNVFDPTEVTPELCADVGVKKGEKVDYAILIDGKPVILFECKHHAVDLSKVHASQLFRYFSVTDARFSVLTNGLNYWFYTDLVTPNIMDEKPFFEFNLLEIKENAVEELKKFSKSTFDLDNILTTAADLKYTKELSRLLLSQMQEPSEEFVKFFARKVYSGTVTQTVRDQFSQLIKQAFKQLLNDQINERLKTALASDPSSSIPTSAEAQVRTPSDPQDNQGGGKDGIVTIEEELEGFHIVKAILREVVDPKRIVMRDVKHYCGVLLDDTNRKPICRLHFNRKQKYVSLFDLDAEEILPISDINELFGFAARFKSTIANYESRTKNL